MMVWEHRRPGAGQAPWALDPRMVARSHLEEQLMDQCDLLLRHGHLQAVSGPHPLVMVGLVEQPEEDERKEQTPENVLDEKPNRKHLQLLVTLTAAYSGG